MTGEPPPTTSAGTFQPNGAAAPTSLPPAAAERLFGDRLPLARAYAALLAGPGIERGLLGPREQPRLWERHLLNCAVVARVLPRSATVCDVGSGAGLPGIAVALARPDVQVTLLEPLLRRATFLQEVIDALGLPGVVVSRDRAEDVAGRRTFHVVIARAVAPLDRLATWSLPLLRPGGVLLAMKGAGAAAEISRAAATLTRLGASEVDVLTLGADLLAEPTLVVRVRAPQRRPVAARAPRKSGRP